MKKKSLGAAVLLAFSLLITGLLVLSPSAAFILLVLAGVIAVIPALLGRGGVRLLGIMLLILSVALSVSYYPYFRGEQQRFMQKDRHIQ